MTPTVTIHYLGNFGPTHATESHVALSLESLGYRVNRIQEGEVRVLDVLMNVANHRADRNVFLWTQTYGLAETGGTLLERQAMLEQLRAFTSGKTVAFHLDRWWGLAREHQVSEEPFFQCDYVFTADGGHQEEFASVGVNHFWSPPAVYHAECYDGTPRREFKADVVFVGSWQSYAHTEWWPHRKAMLDALRQHFGPRFKCFPRNRAIRGKDLNDLYASVKVVVGDSCLAPARNGQPIQRYWSDRIPETTGRGAMLVHPYVEGISDWHKELVTFPIRDLDYLISTVNAYLIGESEKGFWWEQGREVQSKETRSRNTYQDRLANILNRVLGEEFSRVD